MNFPALTIATNDALVACIAWNNETNTVIVSDANSGAWAEVSGFPHHSKVTGNTIDLWYSVGHPAGSTMVTITYKGLGQISLASNLSVFTGIATSTPVDIATSYEQNSNMSQWGTGIINTSSPLNALVGCAWNASGATGISVVQSGTGGGSPNALTSIKEGANQLVGAYQIVAKTGTLGFNWTWSHASEGLGAIAALRAIPAAKPTN